MFDVQWGLGRDDVSTADVLASGTEAEMKAELKARKTPAAPRPTAETQPRPKPKASGKRKAEATSAPPAKKQAAKTTKLVKVRTFCAF